MSTTPVERLVLTNESLALRVPASDDIVDHVVSQQLRLIFQWLCYAILGQFVAIFGIASNIINIICFVKQGFKEPMNISLLGLSVSDLCSLIAVAWSNICYNPAFIDQDWSFDPIEIQYLTGAWPHVTFTRITSWITAFITMERCLCVAMPLKVKNIITPKRVTVAMISLYFVLFVTVCPIYFIASYGSRYSAERNKTVIGIIYTDDRETIEGMTHAFNIVLIPFSAFVTVIICTVVLVVKLRMKTKWRETSTSSAACETLSSRDQKLTRMIAMVSALFLVCFFPVCVLVTSMLIVPELSVNGKYMNTFVAIGGLGFVLESTNSAMNIFIYYHMSSRYRAVFHQFILCPKIIFTKTNN